MTPEEMREAAKELRWWAGEPIQNIQRVLELADKLEAWADNLEHNLLQIQTMEETGGQEAE